MTLNEESIKHLQSLGFAEEDSIFALHTANGNLHFATYLLLEERSNFEPYVPNIPRSLLIDMKVGSKIDCRDNVGKIHGAVIKRIQENGDWCIHFQNYHAMYDEWVNPKIEAWRFSDCNTLSKRLVTREKLKHLRCGDMIDINPRRHPGWRPGRIRSMDMTRKNNGSIKSGQVQVEYNALDKAFWYWIHLDNPVEAAPYSFMTDLAVLDCDSQPIKKRKKTVFVECMGVKLPCKLPQDIQTLRETVDMVEELSRNLRHRLKELEEKDRVCGICMDRRKETALVPCGHRYCASCPANFGVCPICSKAFSDVIKIY